MKRSKLEANYRNENLDSLTILTEGVGAGEEVEEEAGVGEGEGEGVTMHITTIGRAKMERRTITRAKTMIKRTPISTPVVRIALQIPQRS